VGDSARLPGYAGRVYPRSQRHHARVHATGATDSHWGLDGDEPMNLVGDVRAREWARVVARSAGRARPSFVAVDGEGIEGRYVLLAASGNYVPPLVGLEGLATRDMLAWLLRLRRQIPNGARLISYGFNYDVQNMMANL